MCRNTRHLVVLEVFRAARRIAMCWDPRVPIEILLEKDIFFTIILNNIHS